MDLHGRDARRGHTLTLSPAIGKMPGPPGPSQVPFPSYLRYELFQLLLDVALVGGPGDRQLLHDQAARRVEHPALAEGQGLHPLEPKQVAEDLGDLEQRAGLDLFHEAAITAIPGLAIDVDLLVAENGQHLLDLLGPGDPTQTDLVGLVDRDQDPQAAVQRAQHVEALDLAEDLFLLDPDDL